MAWLQQVIIQNCQKHKKLFFYFQQKIAQQNSYIMSHLSGTVTTRQLDSDSVVTLVTCRQHGDY